MFFSETRCTLYRLRDINNLYMIHSVEKLPMTMSDV